MRKLILGTIFLILLLPLINAQQNTQYTQFMYNKLWLNPAYAGSHNTGCVQAIARNQWQGLDGAPSSQAISFHMPIAGKRAGVGLSLMHDEIGPSNEWLINANYAYRIPMGKGQLSFGLQGSIKNYRIDFALLNTVNPDNSVLPSDLRTRNILNFGAGVYYYGDKFYAGVSVPYILSGDLGFAENGDLDQFAEQVVHYYAMGGYLFDISSKVKLNAQALFKSTSVTPFDMDLNASLIFFDKLWTGVSYRHGGSTAQGIGESIDLVLQYQPTPSLRLGMAYDFTLSEIKNYSDGTLEFMAQYCISYRNDKITNPRFF